MNISSTISDVQDLLFKASAFALFANEFDVGEELHFNRHRAIALANFTSSTRQVERKVRWLESSRLSFSS